MRIEWNPDNRPDAAMRIAAHTQAVIASMNDATSMAQVRGLFDDWMRFAKDNRVCQPIVDHMVAKRRQLVSEFEKPKAPGMTDTSRRMTGEHVE